MADALVERRPTARFFCHRCNIEFEDVLQDYTCPYCASGFIEQLETEAEAGVSGDDFSDADMSNLDDVSNLDGMSNLDDLDDVQQSIPPMLNDLAFLMSGGRLRGAGRRETLMEQLVWMIGGGRGAAQQGAPFVLVGAPGDYVFGGEGLDAVVTQLLGQLENAGPPPLPRERIAALPSEPVSAAQAAANASCSVCWENFQLGETISRLECDHIFHAACITPWLQLHATCPVCRRSLLPAPPEPPPAGIDDADIDADEPTTDNTDNTNSTTPSLPRMVVRRLARAARPSARAWDSSSGSSMSLGSRSPAATPPTPPTPRTPPTPGASSAPSTGSASSTSTSDSSSLPDRAQINMEIDFDFD